MKLWLICWLGAQRATNFYFNQYMSSIMAFIRVARCRWVTWTTKTPHNDLYRKPITFHLALPWRHNGRDGVSDHQPHYSLLNRLSRSRSRKQQSFASLAFVRGIRRWSVNSPHKEPVTRECFHLMMSSRIACICGPDFGTTAPRSSYAGTRYPQIRIRIIPTRLTRTKFEMPYFFNIYTRNFYKAYAYLIIPSNFQTNIKNVIFISWQWYIGSWGSVMIGTNSR